MRSRALALAILNALALSLPAWTETAEWSRFRGRTAAVPPTPVEMVPDHNPFWRTEIPAGDSAPLLSAERIFLTASEGEALYTIALNRETGSEFW